MKQAKNDAPFPPSNLASGINFVKYMIRRPDFLELVGRDDPQMKPSSIISKLFSSRGLALWPDPENFPEGKIPNGTVFPPKGVVIAPLGPERPWSIILKDDDSRGLITAVAYGEDTSRPLFAREILIKGSRFPEMNLDQ